MKVCIYALREMGTSEIRYVGQTEHPKERKWQHWYSGSIDSARKVENWIGQVKDRGGHIEMIGLQECEAHQASYWECYWIGFYSGFGAQLLNKGLPIGEYSRGIARNKQSAQDVDFWAAIQILPDNPMTPEEREEWRLDVVFTKDDYYD